MLYYTHGITITDVFTKNIQFVNREKCARPYTFLLEVSRSAQSGDTNNLVMKTNGIETTIEYVSLFSNLPFMRNMFLHKLCLQVLFISRHKGRGITMDIEVE